MEQLPHLMLQKNHCYLCKLQINTNDNNYFPCKCTGTRVHKECIEQYIQDNHKTKCDICNENYTIIYEDPMLNRIAKYIYNKLTLSNIAMILLWCVIVFQSIAMSIIIYLNNGMRQHTRETKPLYICIGISCAIEMFTRISVELSRGLHYTYIIYSIIMYICVMYEFIANRILDEPVYRIIPFIARNIIMVSIIVLICIYSYDGIKKLAKEKNKKVRVISKV